MFIHRSRDYGNHWFVWYLENSKVIKYKCTEVKFFDNRENTWGIDKKIVESWAKDDPNLPSWLKEKLQQLLNK